MSDEDIRLKIESLETKITFQDDLIERLNQSIVEQQNDIRRLILMVEKMHLKMEDLQQPGVLDASLEAPPPHY